MRTKKVPLLADPPLNNTKDQQRREKQLEGRIKDKRRDLQHEQELAGVACIAKRDQLASELDYSKCAA